MTDLISAHLAHLKAAGKSPHTTEDRRRLLLRVDDDLPYGVARAAVEEWEAWLGHDGWSQQTRATYWAHGNGFYEWAVRRGFIDWNPLAYVERPKVPAGVPRPVTDDELAYAIDRSRRPWRTAILLSAYAGMRAGEVALATREQISGPEIRILGKGGKTRIVPNHEMILAEVAHLPPGPLLVAATGRVRDSDAVSHLASAYLTRIGLPDVTLHRFRHWYGTATLAACGNLRIVQELMGHSSPAVTAVYTQITSEQRRLVVGALPTLASPRQEAA